jgi:predicted kinase
VTAAIPTAIVQMHGEPGSGKSTVARALAAELRGIVIDKDLIKAALLRVGIQEAPAAAGAYEAYFALAASLARQTAVLILDNPVNWPSVEGHWQRLAAAVGSPLLLIECVCPDRDELVRRLATRDALESQPRDPLDMRRFPDSAPTAYEPRLTLDTRRPLDEIVADAAAYVRAAIAAVPA